MKPKILQEKREVAAWFPGDTLLLHLWLDSTSNCSILWLSAEGPLVLRDGVPEWGRPDVPHPGQGALRPLQSHVSAEPFPPTSSVSSSLPVWPLVLCPSSPAVKLQWLMVENMSLGTGWIQWSSLKDVWSWDSLIYITVMLYCMECLFLEVQNKLQHEPALKSKRHSFSVL